jgi:hypothetical protein
LTTISHLIHRGKATLLNAAKLLAMPAYDFLTFTQLREQTAQAFKKA